MTDGYHKSAQRLSVVSAEDRAWVLSMLEAEDRIRLMAALHDLHAPAEQLDASEDAIPSSRTSLRQFDSLPTQSVFDSLSSADSETVRALLDEQPEWVRALLVADVRWSWVEGYLASLDAEKLQQLEELVRRISTTIKPRVRTAVEEIISDWLSTYDRRTVQDSAFDALLTRLRQQAQTTPRSGSSI